MWTWVSVALRRKMGGFGLRAMKPKNGEVSTETLKMIKSALSEMSEAVSKPTFQLLPSGRSAYRYDQHSFKEAIILKIVRMMSALYACRALLEAGLFLDIGSTMRILDEVSSDIMFLSGPRATRTEPEARHGAYLKEFFQEEFDQSDPLMSTQSRNRVSRRQIRAYNARTYENGDDVSSNSKLSETIDNAMSGYVHGAAVHILDVFDGKDFPTHMVREHSIQAVMERQYVQYVHRSVMAVCVAALAFDNVQLFDRLNTAISNLFNDVGEPR